MTLVDVATLLWLRRLGSLGLDAWIDAASLATFWPETALEWLFSKR